MQSLDNFKTDTKETQCNRIVVPRISWPAKTSIETVLRDNRLPKRQATFFGHVMRREKLKHILTTGMIKGKRSKGKQPEKMLEGRTKWLKVGQVTEAMKATRDRDAWKVMTAYTKEHCA